MTGDVLLHIRLNQATYCFESFEFDGLYSWSPWTEGYAGGEVVEVFRVLRAGDGLFKFSVYFEGSRAFSVIFRGKEYRELAEEAFDSLPEEVKMELA